MQRTEPISLMLRAILHARRILLCTIAAGLFVPLNARHLQAQSVGPQARPPGFKLPFKCDERWRLTTRNDHVPENAKIDFYDARERDLDPRSDRHRYTWLWTEGSAVYASAPGRVVEIVPDNGEVTIDHGHGWYSIYIHMFLPGEGALGFLSRLEVNDYVGWGDLLGFVSDVNVGGVVGIPHLHFEQGYDADGSGEVSFLDASTERTIPLLEGQLYVMEWSRTDVVRSTNACQHTTEVPPGSYEDSCHACELSGDFLSCLCADRSGNDRPTYLYLPCAEDLANCDGMLTCGTCTSDDLGAPNPRSGGDASPPPDAAEPPSSGNASPEPDATEPPSGGNTSPDAPVDPR